MTLMRCLALFSCVNQIVKLFAKQRTLRCSQQGVGQNMCENSWLTLTLRGVSLRAVKHCAESLIKIGGKDNGDTKKCRKDEEKFNDTVPFSETQVMFFRFYSKNSSLTQR